MSRIEYVNEITIDFDLDTAIMLDRIINSAITISCLISCLPIDPECYPSIEKLKTLSQLSGLITIKLPNVVLLDTDCLEYKGIKEAKEV